MNEYDQAIEEDLLKGRYLTFSVDKIVFGIEIMFVSEIVGILPLTEVPESPVYLKGVINLRG